MRFGLAKSLDKVAQMLHISEFIKSAESKGTNGCCRFELRASLLAPSKRAWAVREQAPARVQCFYFQVALGTGSDRMQK